MSGDRSGRSVFAKLRAIIREPAVREIAALIPPKGRYGRRRHYDPFVWVVYLVASVYVWNSAHEAEEHFADPIVWRFIRREIKRQFPNNPEMWPPRRSMKRYHFLHALTYLRRPDIQARMREVLTANAVTLAQGTGLIREDRMGSWTYPNPDNVITFDGKVLKPASSWPEGAEWVDEETGEIKVHRFDPDAAWYRVGDNEDDDKEVSDTRGPKRVYGDKHGILSVGGIILGVGTVPREGGEPALLEHLLAEVLPQAPGVQGLTTDGILRGVHINRIQTTHGIICVSPVFADRREPPEKGRRRGKGHYDAYHIEDSTRTTPHGDRIRVLSKRGHVGYEVIDEVGDRQYHKAERIRRTRRGGPKKYSFHGQYQLPPELGGGELSVQFNHTREKDGGDYRAEHLRLIPFEDDYHDEIYGLRNRSESHNSGLQRTLPWGRAHSYGSAAQVTDMIGYALGQNALEREDHRHRKRQELAA